MSLEQALADNTAALQAMTAALLKGGDDGKVVVNGVDQTAIVSIINKATGVYTATFILPTLNNGDLASLRISATVNSIATATTRWP